MVEVKTTCINDISHALALIVSAGVDNEYLVYTNVWDLPALAVPIKVL